MFYSKTRINEFAIRMAFDALMSDLTIEEVFLALGFAANVLAAGEAKRLSNPAMVDRARELFYQAFAESHAVLSKVQDKTRSQQEFEEEAMCSVMGTSSSLQ